MSFSIASEFLPFLQLYLKPEVSEESFTEAVKIVEILYGHPVQRIRLHLPDTSYLDCSIVSLDKTVQTLFNNPKILSEQHFPYYIGVIYLLMHNPKLELLADIGTKKVPFGIYQGNQFKNTSTAWQERILTFENSTAQYPVDAKQEIKLMWETKNLKPHQNAKIAFSHNLQAIKNFLL